MAKKHICLNVVEVYNIIYELYFICYIYFLKVFKKKLEFQYEYLINFFILEYFLDKITLFNNSLTFSTQKICFIISYSYLSFTNSFILFYDFKYAIDHIFL